MNSFPEAHSQTKQSRFPLEALSRTVDAGQGLTLWYYLKIKQADSSWEFLSQLMFVLPLSDSSCGSLTHWHLGSWSCQWLLSCLWAGPSTPCLGCYDGDMKANEAGPSWITHLPPAQIPCGMCVVLGSHTSESKGRVDNCVWKKSKEILSLLLGLKYEGDSTEQKWRQRYFRCKGPAAQGLRWWPGYLSMAGP